MVLKTSTGIKKYESEIVKSIPAIIPIFLKITYFCNGKTVGCLINGCKKNLLWNISR